MRAGELRHAIYIRNPTKIPDAKGDMEFYYNPPVSGTEIDAYASIEPLVGRELIVAKGIRSDISHKIRLRYGEVDTLNQMSQIYWWNGIKMEVYKLGPLINKELRNIEASFYAYSIS